MEAKQYQPSESTKFRSKKILIAIAELEQILEPYQNQWDIWITTRHCFLSVREISIIESYKKHYSHTEAAQQFNLTRERIRILYRRALTKLRCKAYFFHQSMGQHILEEAGLINQTANEKFLEAPLYEHNMSTRLYYALGGGHFKNMKELLQISRKELRRFRGLGKKSLVELEQVLQENNCLHLLRKE